MYVCGKKEMQKCEHGCPACVVFIERGVADGVMGKRENKGVVSFMVGLEKKKETSTS